MRFLGICLVTDDVPALARFYDRALQTESDIDPIHTSIQTQGASLAIYSRRAAERDMQLFFDRRPGGFTLQFLVDDVQKQWERLKTLGVEIVREPTVYPWGSRSMQCKDPDGNLITFASPV